MRVKEILVNPWQSPNAKFLFEIWKDGMSDDNQGIPLAVMSGTQIKLYIDHPLLWSREVYFRIGQIAKISGNRIFLVRDFQRS